MFAHKPAIFVGPSLASSVLDEVSLFDFDLHDPIKRGDLPALVEASSPRVIAIVDGEFYQNLAVSPKEILAAIAKGNVLVGAASMGALRAAEMHPFGMFGVGLVFEWYKSGRVIRDDDVALMYSNIGSHYQPTTIPMVSVRWAVQRGREEGWLSLEGARSVAREARRLHWTDRTRLSLLEKSTLSQKESQSLRLFLANGRNDLKDIDARLCILVSRSLHTAGSESRDLERIQ